MMMKTIGALFIWAGSILFGWTLAFDMLRSLLKPAETDPPTAKPGVGLWFAALVVVIVLGAFTAIPVIFYVVTR